MKKLTAGIFATILGLTAVDAFAAAAGTPVASTNYVQGAIQSLDSAKDNGTAPIAGVTMTDGKVTAVKAADMSAYALKTEAYDDTELAGRVTAAEGKITTIEGQQTTQDGKIKALEEAGYITDAALTNLATKTEVSTAKSEAIADAAADAATKYVTTTTYSDGQSEQDAKILALEEANAKLNDTYVTETELTNSQNAQNTTIASTYATQTALEAVKATADAAAPQATTYTKTEVDGLISASEYDDTELAGRVSTAEGKITTIEGQQTTQDGKIKALEEAGYITNAALDGLATEGYVDAAVLVEHEVNETQAQQINAISTEQATQNSAIDALEAAAGNYVKWTDVVDSYTE